MRTIRQLVLFVVLGMAFSGCVGRSVQQVSVIPDIQKIGNLEGSYSMTFTSMGETRYSTAVVKKVSDHEYQIARVTVYGPVLYTFKLGNDATVSSAELGEGELSYRDDLKQTTIRFERENFICELTR